MIKKLLFLHESNKNIFLMSMSLIKRCVSTLFIGAIFLTNINASGHYKFESSSMPGATSEQTQSPSIEDSREVPNIIGVWRFVGHVYRGEVIPPFNDKLVLTFEFLEDGTNILKWYRLGENGFCERTANYQYDGKNLVQEVIAVNPKNSFECGQDSDMRIGTKSISSFYKNANNMYLELPLGEETLIYIWAPSLWPEPEPSLIPMPTFIPTPTPVPTPT